MKSLAFALLVLGACMPAGTTAPHPTDIPNLDTPRPAPVAPRIAGTFGIYVRRDSVDAFPSAPSPLELSGWGYGDNHGFKSHFVVVSARPGESADAAVARRSDVTPELPAGTSLVYEVGKPFPAADAWAFNSIVVDATPVVTTTGLAACAIVDQPNVTISMVGSSTTAEAVSWPYLALTWTDATRAKLAELVASQHDIELEVVYGDEVIDHWSPGYAADPSRLELEIPAPDLASARAYAAGLRCH